MADELGLAVHTKARSSGKLPKLSLYEADLSDDAGHSSESEGRGIERPRGGGGGVLGLGKEGSSQNAAPGESVTFTVDMEDAPGAVAEAEESQGAREHTPAHSLHSDEDESSLSTTSGSESSNKSTREGLRQRGVKGRKLGRERGGGGGGARPRGGLDDMSPDGDDVDSMDSYMLLGRSLGAELGFLSAEDVNRWGEAAQAPTPARSVPDPELWGSCAPLPSRMNGLGHSSISQLPQLPPLMRTGIGCAGPSTPTSPTDPTGASIPVFPQRLGQALCDFYMKTGHCKFGEGCKFDHPLRFAVALNRAGLPLRPGEAICGYFERTGECKFGPACKFHHPNYPPEHVYSDAPSAASGGHGLGPSGASVPQQLVPQLQRQQQPRQRRGGRRVSDS